MPERVGGSGEFRGDFLQKPGGSKLAERLLGVPGPQDLVVLLDQPWRRAAGDFVPVGRNRIKAEFVDRELEPGGQHDGAQHADRILEEPHFRIANAPDEALVQVAQPSHVVNDRECPDVVEERVHREVAPEGVLLGGPIRVVALEEVILDAPSPATFPIFRRDRLVRRDDVRRPGQRRFDLGRGLGVHQPAKRRHLDRLRPELHVGQAEPTADDPAVPEEFFDLMRVGGRADVEVFRPALEEQVANGTTDQIRDVVVLVQPVEHLESVGIDVPAGDDVFRSRNDGRLNHGPGL
jgi:hypothetical protein